MFRNSKKAKKSPARSDRNLRSCCFEALEDRRLLANMNLSQVLQNPTIGSISNSGDRFAGSEFGYFTAANSGVAIDRGVVVIGAPKDDERQTDAGAIFLYEGESSVPFRLLNPDYNQDQGVASAYEDRFGNDVAIGGRKVFAAAPLDNSFNGSTIYFDSGSVSAYHIDTRTWQKFVNPNPNSQNYGHFGKSIAATDQVLIVGADERASIPGAPAPGNGVVYAINPNDGSTVSYLDNPTSNSVDAFGADVDVHGNWAIIGDPGDFVPNVGGAGVGSAYLWNWQTGFKVQIANPTPNSQEYFGKAVAIHDGKIVITAPGDDSNGNNSGVAYLFTFNPNSASPAPSWTATIINPGAAPAGDLFGSSVDISANAIVIGADADSTVSSNYGRAYSFTTAGVLQQTFSPLSSAHNFGTSMRFGASVAIDQGTTTASGAEAAVFGAPVANPSNSGGAFVYATDRTSLSYTVNSTADLPDSTPGDGIALATNGLVTLRAAVQEASLGWEAPSVSLTNPAYSFFSLDLQGAEVLGTGGGDLDITGQVRINGLAPGFTIIDASGTPGDFLNDRVFDVKPGASLTLDRLTVAGGRAYTPSYEFAGGIWVESSAGALPYAPGTASLSLNQVAVVNNFAQNLAGGIWNSKGDVTIIDSVIAGNHVENSDNLNIAAGGIHFNGGTTRFGGTVVADNSAWGPILNRDGQFGGIGAVVDLHNNRFEEVGSPISNGVNGNYVSGSISNDAIVVVSSAIDTFYDPDNLRNLSLREAINAANSAAGALREIWLPSWKMTLDRARLAGFTAGGNDTAEIANGDLDVYGNIRIRGGGAGISIIDGQGAAGINDRVFHVLPGATLSIFDVTIAGGNANVAGDDFAGGAYIQAGSSLTLTRTAVAGNTAKRYAGALWNAGGNLTLLNSVVAANTVTNTPGDVFASGGVHSNTTASGTLSLGGTVLANNTKNASPVAQDIYAYTTPATFTDNGYNRLEVEESPIVIGVNNNYVGSADIVVTSIADNAINHADDARALTMREAVDLANTTVGWPEVWLPALRFMITRPKKTAGGDSTMVQDGDIDILGGSLTIRGVAGRTFIGSMGIAVADKVFELVGDYDRQAFPAGGGGGSYWTVAAADEAVWTSQHPNADGNDDNFVNAADHALWSANLGNAFYLIDVVAALDHV